MSNKFRKRVQVSEGSRNEASESSPGIVLSVHVRDYCLPEAKAFL